MNYALKAVNMKIIVTGEVDEGNWKIADGRALTRFYEDANLGYMRVPSKGASTANRAKVRAAGGGQWDVGTEWRRVARNGRAVLGGAQCGNKAGIASNHVVGRQGPVLPIMNVIEARKR